MTIKNYIDVAQASARGADLARGVVFSARKRDSRVVGVVGCSPSVGVEGEVEATALAEMVLECAFSGVALSVAAGWVVRSFGDDCGFAVVDLDENSGEFDVLEYRCGDKSARELQVSVVGEDRPVERICESTLSLVSVSQGDPSAVGGVDSAGSNGSNGGLGSNKTQSKALIMRGTLETGDMIVFGSWLRSDQLDETMGGLIAQYDDMAERVNLTGELTLHDSLMGLVAQIPLAMSKDAEIQLSCLHRRMPRRLLFCSGPPFNDRNDENLCRRVEQWQGTKLIAGGTTAQIISRGLGREINVNLRRDVSGLPPTSSMEGVDLITEGVLTLSRLNALLERVQSTDLQGQGIDYDVVRMLLRHDEIEFLVGTRINVVHQDPNLPMELELRRNVIKRIAAILEQKFLKRVRISYL